MKKELKCVPEAFLHRLNSFAEKLWKEKNPSSVELSAIMEEFEDEMLSYEDLAGKTSEDFKKKLENIKAEKAEAEAEAEKRIEILKEKNEKILAENLKMAEEIKELREAVKAGESRLAEAKAEISLEKTRLTMEYSARTQSLYEEIRVKEEAMLKKWEEKNRDVENRLSAIEREYNRKVSELKMKEKSLNEDFLNKKKDLIRTFEKVRADLENREKEVLKKQEKIAEWEKKYAVSRFQENKDEKK